SPWRTPATSRSTSSSRRSGPSSHGSVITFDPARLAVPAPELEQERGAVVFGDDQQRAAATTTEHSRVTKRLERYRRLAQEYGDAKELAAMDGDMGEEIASRLPA